MSAAPFQRDVSATLDELANWVVAAYPDAHRDGAGTYHIESGDAALTLSATPGPERRIALLRLPTLRIEYRFTRGSAEGRAALLRRLDLYMHRGGG